jgi:lysophospholipase L1-like esterase
MKTRNLLKHLSVALMVLIIFQSGYSAPIDSTGNKTIVVLGSSVAAGWVTSYKEKYDMQNGYAVRLGRIIESRGWTLKNISIPGFDTRSTLARFEKDVLPLNPRYVFIGLSMANEGLTTENPDSVFVRYRDGIAKLIALCREHDMMPVVGLCYSNNDYSESQYEYLKRMNLLISSWDVPCVNLLGALDDGSGHFPAGYTFDAGHPDDRGHEELFYSIVPDLFDALSHAKKFSMPAAVGSAAAGEKFIPLGKRGNFQQIGYIPNEVMHPFSMGFSFRTSGEEWLGEVKALGVGAIQILVNKEGHLVYQSKEKLIVSLIKPEKINGIRS